jgi:hypothetical protein
MCIFFELLLTQSVSQKEGLNSATSKSPEDIFTAEFLSVLDAIYGFSKSRNSEIMSRWQSLCLLSNAEWIYPQVSGTFATDLATFKL